MRKVILVHGWDGTPNTGWFPWLQRELEARGFVVVAPQLPDTDAPRIATWVPALAEAIGTVGEHMYLVGHSMGCQAILRYLEALPAGQKVGGAIFVAGFFRPLTGLETDEEREIDAEWANTPIDTDKVRSHLPESFALFSDDDPWVPAENAKDFRDRLGSETLIQHGQRHFNEGAGFTTLPIVLEKLLEMAAS
ncbi:MAG TPA: alpha/beta fold hydrolase [Candidatus Paceibacterota bacterium]|nr:alpha/beta fold hydrolase [Candidatus Paceibacterota bacterium]